MDHGFSSSSNRLRVFLFLISISVHMGTLCRDQEKRLALEIPLGFYRQYSIILLASKAIAQILTCSDAGRQSCDQRKKISQFKFTSGKLDVIWVYFSKYVFKSFYNLTSFMTLFTTPREIFSALIEAKWIIQFVTWCKGKRCALI